VVVSQDVRDLIDMLAEHLHGLLEPGGEFRTALDAIVDVSTMYHDEINAASDRGALPDEVYEAVSEASGYWRLYQYAGEISGALQAIV